jgi:hypothetical protein
MRHPLDIRDYFETRVVLGLSPVVDPGLGALWLIAKRLAEQPGLLLRLSWRRVRTVAQYCTGFGH